MLNRWMRRKDLRYGSLLVLMMVFLSNCSDSDSGKDSGPAGIILNFRPAEAGEQAWTAQLEGQSQSLSPVPTDFGLQFQAAAPASRVAFKLGDKTLSYDLDAGTNQYWIYEQSRQVFTLAPPSMPSDRELVVYWQNDQSDPGSWGLHLWDDAQGGDWTKWAEPLAASTPASDFGTIFRIPLPPAESYSANPGSYESFPNRLGLIVHKGNDKSTETNQYLEPQNFGGLFFLKEGDSTVYCTPDFEPCGIQQLRVDASAHWLSKTSMVWQQRPREGWRYALLASPSGALQETDLSAADKIEWALTPDEQAADTAKAPHLSAFASYRLAELPLAEIDKLMQSQLVAAAWNQDGQLQAFSRVQTPFVVDELYGTDESLGLVIADDGSASINFWSPTASKVKLVVFDADKKPTQTIELTRNQAAVWSTEVNPEWLTKRYFYQFQLTTLHPQANGILTLNVTDPYSVSLATDSQYSQFVNLADDDLKPEGWDLLTKPAIAKQNISILETHVRDFSISDPSVPVALRGLYLAFTEAADTDQLSQGRRYLKTLAEAGLTHVQLLPVNDIASVIEDKKIQVNLDDPFTDLCKKSNAPKSLCELEAYKTKTIREVYEGADKSSSLIQDLNKFLHDVDGFNWGYDPYHYGVPEGSYATDPDGVARIKEFRQLVMALDRLGLRLSIDVVYNHTFASGLYSNSVLDKAVPGYFHRRDPVTGNILNSTCCANTASEHKMMERLMIDTLKRWVSAYKVDAFRFDLMGHHLKRNMVAVQKALGEDIYLYGEGWNFGEVADNQRGVNATQINLKGTGIGTFNDRFRDSIRGGGPFDCGVLLFQQGYGNGLFVNDNEKGGLLQPTVDQPNCLNASDFTSQSQEAKKANFSELTDRVRIGLAGSIADFELVAANGEQKKASEFGGPRYPIGYTSQPWETINYISKHDNQTLWDINQIKLPLSMNLADRVAVQEFGISLNTFAQGLPFFHFGVDLLRSKSLNRDSYNSGDWFNRVDFSFADNNWNVGLPRIDKDGDNYPFFAEILTAVPEGPDRLLIERSYEYFRTLLSVRTSSPLFRLPNAASIKERVRFQNTGPQDDALTGIIIMKIDDNQCLFAEDLDENLQDLMVIFNPRPEAITVAAAGYEVHPTLQARVSASEEGFRVPAFGTAVITRAQQSECLEDVKAVLLR